MISLSSRVSIAAALVLTTFIIITAYALEQAFEQSARSAMRERLFAQLYLVMADTEVNKQGQVELPPELGEVRLNLPGSGLRARIGTPTGESLWQSASAVGNPLPAPSVMSNGNEQFGLLYLEGEAHFVTSLTVSWQTDNGALPLVFSVVENPTSYVEQMSRYRQTLWGWLAGMAIVALLALLAALAWGLRPLRTAASEVRAIEGGKQEGLTRDYPKEIKRLTDNINNLLQHEHAQQQRYKNALGDLAHSLKTPLAVLRSLEEKVGEQSAALNEQIERMDNIVQYQLQRAATAGRSALTAPIAVVPIATRLVTTLEKVYRDRPIKLQTEWDSNSHFRGDEGDLMELLGNLMDNAFKWSNSTINLTIKLHGEQLLICIEDDGPGIEAVQIDVILSRGVRLDEATPGHGIGLPMVLDIVEAYEGKLHFTKSELGGAKVEVVLPGK